MLAEFAGLVARILDRVTGSTAAATEIGVLAIGRHRNQFGNLGEMIYVGFSSAPRLCAFVWHAAAPKNSKP